MELVLSLLASVRVLFSAAVIPTLDISERLVASKESSKDFITLFISFAPIKVFADYGKDGYDYGMQFALSGSYKEALNFFLECANSNYIKK